ncbi:MAG: phospholipid/cholesterol/gamma-HCH transport system permease protein [Halieaceae bacterium]
MSDDRVRLEIAPDGAVRLVLSGDWSTREAPDLSATLGELASADRAVLTVDATALAQWDSRLTALLLRIDRQTAETNTRLELLGGPASLAQLLSLATAVPQHVPPAASTHSLLSLRELRIQLAGVGDGFLDSLAFLGAALRAIGRTLIGRGAMRRRELMDSCFQAGPDALGIVALTSMLVGMILAYLGAAQLQQFGAAIYVADLVAIGMLREMGALMTAVVMAGRTGAAYAAQLSSMQTNEEIDAISTLGIDPMEFLVAPRIIALFLMMPLLVIFSNALGIVGGAIVSGSMGVTPLQYVSQLQSAISYEHFFVGLIKALVFALLIAVAGCRAGMNAGRNSAAVGKATTDAVVTAVVYLIIADAAINILCQQLGY